MVGHSDVALDPSLVAEFPYPRGSGRASTGVWLPMGADPSGAGMTCAHGLAGTMNRGRGPRRDVTGDCAP
jgi:hypothetical protein